ncbi:hypothetical protein [Nocardia sp. GAS34]|uniref:hypothetical protein n=1 Tax=unclassified Nocardia TaxID=2637762 RepID=UPI003D1DD63B
MTDLSPLAAAARAAFGDAGVHAIVRAAAPSTPCRASRTGHAVVLGQWVGFLTPPKRPVTTAKLASETG